MDIDAALAAHPPRDEQAVSLVAPAILAIDPGTDRSAWLVLDGQEVRERGIDDNGEVLRVLRHDAGVGWQVVIERVEPRYGLRIGWETVSTIEWVGRFTEAAHPLTVALVARSDVLRHLSVAPGGNADSGVRMAMLDRWGGVAACRKGGPLAGLRTHLWQALGAGVAWREGCRPSLLTTDGGER